MTNFYSDIFDGFYGRLSPPYGPDLRPSDLGKKSSYNDEAKSRRLRLIKGGGPWPIRRSDGTISGFRFPSGSVRPDSYIFQMGDYRHSMYQRGIRPQDRVEAPVNIPLLSRQGPGERGTFRIDVLRNAQTTNVFNMFAPQKVEEIKTVDIDFLRSMRAPKPSAVSQINAYMYATGTDVATLTYIARQNQNEQRQFEVPFQPGMLIADIRRAREELLYPWIQQTPEGAINTETPLGYHYNRRGSWKRRPYRKAASTRIGPIKSRAYNHSY